MGQAGLFIGGVVLLTVGMGAVLVLAAWFARRRRPTLAERLVQSHQVSVADAAEEWLRAYELSTKHGRRPDKR